MSDKLRYRLEVLAEKHAIRGFTCEDEDINEYARQVALEDNNHNLALTFVEIDNDEPATKNVAGFFTLRAHAVRITDIDTENGTGDTKEVPLAELMCLARDERWKQRGIGDALMIDALSIIAKASECIGFIGVHLRSTEHGTKLYERYDFQEFKAHPQRDKMRYILSVKTIKEIVSLLP